MTPNDIAKFVDELQRGHRACADPGCWRRMSRPTAAVCIPVGILCSEARPIR